MGEELSYGPAMTVAAGVEFERNCRWGNHSLIKKREEPPFYALLNKAEFGEVLNIAFNVNAIMGLCDLNEFCGRASERANRHTTVPID